MAEIQLARAKPPGSVLPLAKLIETRMLVQGGSGSGKSTLLRRLLEVSCGKVQQIIIDPEGEYATLRQIGDYLIAGEGGDVPTDIKTAALLAKRIRQTGVSAIIDVYELKPAQRGEYVAQFLNGLLGAPKKYWRDCLLLIDEAHVFAPQSRKSPSLAAVQDTAARGRKRRLGLIVATQRLAKLHNDVAAECRNRLIGQTGLKNDLRSAAEEMGVTYAEARKDLLLLKSGEFWAFGPALYPEYVLFRAALPKTKIATADTKIEAASASLSSVIASLSDLPKQAAKDLQTLKDLQAEVKQLRAALRKAQRGAPVIDESVIQKRIDAALASLPASVPATDVAKIASTLGTKTAALQKALDAAQAATMSIGAAQIELHALREQKSAAASQRKAPATRAKPPARPRAPAEAVDGVSGPQQKILDALSQMAGVNVDSVPKPVIAGLVGASAKSSAYTNNLGRLRTLGLIDYPQPGQVALTDDGRAAASPPPDNPTLADYHANWRKLVSGPQWKIVEQCIAAHPEPLDKIDLAAAVEASWTSSAYTNNLGRLRTLGLIEYPQPGQVVATDQLFPDGLS